MTHVRLECTQEIIPVVVPYDKRSVFEFPLDAAPDDALSAPSDMAFGTGMGNRKQIFITNFAPPPLGGGTPGVVTMDVGVPGRPLP